MILDWFDLSFLEWILLAFLLFAFLVQLFFYICYYNGVWRKSNRIRKGKDTFSEEFPPVSVIVCARNQAEDLGRNLPKLLEQDYPEFQVVVVNDASTDDTEDLLIRLEQNHPHLYHTFVPAGVQSVSAKKMAMNIGIKAAKYDILLFTEANCIPNGHQWISSMVRHFKKDCDIVLAYSSYKKMKGLVKMLISYDTLFTALKFMGASMAGKPYMGNGRNLAYRKELFFRNRGFASYLNLESGEDDLFIKEIANKTNTSIEVSPESKICVDSQEAWMDWKDRNINHITTSSYYKAGTKFRTSMELLSRFLFYGLTIALLIIGIYQLQILLLIAAGLLFIIRYSVQLSVINRSARCFDENRFYLSIPFNDLILPIIKLWFRFYVMFHKSNGYTRKVLH